jgi:pimeloyl-ACP methyl ester carboxylesterase
MRRSPVFPLTIIVICLAVLATAGLGPGSASSLLPSQTTGSGKIEFQPQSIVSAAGESVNAESGWLVVPENRALAQSTSIRLPVVRFRSTSAKPGFPIVYLAGGPGESGIQSAKENIFPVLLALRAQADVIVYDQRGTGSAEPSLVVPGNFNLPLDSPLDSAASRERLLAVAVESSAEIRKRGIDLSAYNTNESADDLNDLRVALGAAKINIWGHSYGSHLGLAFLRRHGEFVQRAILGGVNGPDQRWRYPNDLSALIDRVDVQMASIPKLKKQMPSLKEVIAGVLKDLEAKPVTLTVQSQAIVIGRKDLEVLIALQSGDTEFIKGLPAFFGRIKDKDYAQLAAAVAHGLKQREIGTLMRYSMHLASGVSAERGATIALQEKSALFRDAINFPYADPEFRAAWSVRDLGTEFRAPIKSVVPTLFLSGTLDGRTSIADAEEVRRGFSNGRQLIIENASHNFYHLTPAVVEAMLAFLDGREVPERIRVPLEFRGPDERKLVLELRKIILTQGVEAGVKRMREMNSSQSESYLTSYVPGILGQILNREEKKPEAAFAVFQAGVELFPNNEFLNERLAEAYLLAGQKQQALELYKKCLSLNPLNRLAVLKIKGLEAR